MNSRRIWSRFATTAALFLLPFPGIARAAAEYESTEVMVPVRDGMKLHTLLLRPKGDERPLPILLQRTPYGVAVRAQQSLIRGPLKSMADDGYIFAFQDIRGRFGSEGTFVLRAARARPLGPEGRRRDDRRKRYDRLAGQERGGE